MNFVLCCAQLEFYSTQTDYRRKEFWDCLIPTLSREEVARLLELSQTEVHKEGVKSDVTYAVTSYGMFGAPWMAVQRPCDGAEDIFFGTDKLESIAWWLGEFCIFPIEHSAITDEHPSL